MEENTAIDTNHEMIVCPNQDVRPLFNIWKSEGAGFQRPVIAGYQYNGPRTNILPT